MRSPRSAPSSRASSSTQIATSDREFAERAQHLSRGRDRAASATSATRPRPNRPVVWRKCSSAATSASRMEQLVKSGTASQIRSAEAMASHEAIATRCAMAMRTTVAPADRAGSRAEQGVSLRDGANDAPYSQQQRDRLFLRRQELETKMLEETLQAAQIATEMTQERERLDRVSHFDVSLPANHVVWSVAASPGSTVSEGQTVFDLASCEPPLRRGRAAGARVRAASRSARRPPSACSAATDWRRGPGPAGARLGGARRRPAAGGAGPTPAAEQHHRRGRAAGRCRADRPQRTSAISAGSPRCGSSAAGFAFLDGFGEKLRQLAGPLHAACDKRARREQLTCTPTSLTLASNCSRRRSWSSARIYVLGPLLPMARSWARLAVFAIVWLVVALVSPLAAVR